MSKLSKTAAASMRGGPGEVKKDPFDTNEKKIHELRLQRTNKLAVVRYDFIDALIETYDAARALNVSLLKQVADAGDELNKVLIKYNEVQLLLAQEIANVVTRDEAIKHLAQSTSALLKRAEESEEQLVGLRRTLSEAANTGDGNYRP